MLRLLGLGPKLYRPHHDRGADPGHDTHGRPRLVLLTGGRAGAPQPAVEHMRIGRHA